MIPTDNGTYQKEVSLTRCEVAYLDLSNKFRYYQKDFAKQFAHIYAGRLSLSKDSVLIKATEKWGKSVPVRKLSELSDEKAEKCIVVGTLFKHQELKPSILKEISEENQLIPQPPRSNFVSDNDQLILEDDIQRIRLVGTFDIKKLVTGIVVALLGFQNAEGKFEVEDICFKGVNAVNRPMTINTDCYVLLISGLSLSSTTDLVSLDLLTDWITGQAGSPAEQEIQAKVCRVIIAGNSVQLFHKKADSNVINTDVEENASTLTSIKMLDDIVLDLVKTVEVDVLPGEFDPSNHTLPQQPMHYCMFPKSSRYEAFQGATNPYECSIGDRRFLGTSGQPITDIKRLTDIDDEIEILERTLRWGHMAPTAPDTLACYPYYKDDPFIITEQPDVYFAGNQPGFKTKEITMEGRKVQLISVPVFATTRTCVLVNLKNLECTPLVFKTPSGESQ